VIDKFTPTMLFDEAENWITDKASEFRGLVNAGHTRRTAWTVRLVGDKHEPVKFSTWAPKFIALIGALPDTMTDRSIVIPMRRKRKDDRIDPLREAQLIAGAIPLRQQLTRFADDEAERLAEMQPAPVPELRDRANDNWLPLFAIADVVGGDWPGRARKAAIVLSGGAEATDDAPGLQLLEDAYVIHGETLDDVSGVIASADLVKRLNELADRPWADFRGGKGISAAWLAKRLRDFEVVPAGNVRFNGKQSKGYRWAAFDEPWSRYSISQPYHRPNANESGPETAISDRPRDLSGRVAKMAAQPMNTGLWDGGTVAPPIPGGSNGSDDGWGDL
jgi:putative DNA primase/helicase